MRGASPGPDGFHIVERDRVGSTNDEAAAMARDGAEDGTVVWARRQEGGRGRRGRVWQSPEGNLYFSAVMRPAAPPAQAAQLSMVAAVAIAESVAQYLPEAARVEQKWPNDVLIDGRKVAGILLESSGYAAQHVDWVVVGCGINVASAPEGAQIPATALGLEGAPERPLRDWLASILAALRLWRERWDTHGIAPIRTAWLARARGVGQDITVRLPGSEMTGKFVDLDEAGALVLQLPDGSRREITAGDVFL